MKIYIGIDPGKSGGLAFIPERGDPWSVKMPATDKDAFEAIQDAKRFGHIIEDAECFAILELVHSSPQMGVKSAFTFGEGYGALNMALTALGIPYERIRPEVWQKAMGCLTKGDKNVTKRKAQQLFPALGVTHYNADALLIAEYCRRTKS